MCELYFVFIQDSISCPGKQPEEYVVYCIDANSRCGTYKIKRLFEENSVLNFTISNWELQNNFLFNIITIIETINKCGYTNSSEIEICFEGKYKVCYGILY